MPTPRDMLKTKARTRQKRVWNPPAEAPPQRPMCKAVTLGDLLTPEHVIIAMREPEPEPGAHVRRVRARRSNTRITAK